MKTADVEQAFDTLIYKWAEATDEPMPPDGQHHYSFSSFWRWLENNHPSYTQFKAKPNARYVAEMWFDKKMLQAWRN